MESDEITGRPDDSWDEKIRAQYEAIKARALAERTDTPDWLGQPTLPADDLIELLDRLLQESQSRGGKA
jgi:hypothetical protein